MKLNEYEITYPNYCRMCLGWGMFTRLSQSVYLKNCKCLINGCCPRCGKHSLDILSTCSECKWQRDDNNRGLPMSTLPF